MMFFYKKHRHKKHKNKGSSISSGKIKEKKRFGLTKDEMNELMSQMILKPKIPIKDIN